MSYRINGFEQIKSFYSWVFNNQDKGITAQHISLYNFLINQNNRNNWVEWFKCPYDLGMAGSCIGNKKTYYKCLDDLTNWNLIEYQKGTNNWKAPLIKVEILICTATGTDSGTATVPDSEPAVVPLPIPLPTHIYKHITNNIKLITDNWEAVKEFISNLNNIEKVDYEFIKELYHSLCPKMNKVQVLNEQRKGFINARYAEFGIEKITEVIRKAGESDFLNGKNDKAWKADFEWLMRPTNFLKVLEGKYDNHEIKRETEEEHKARILKEVENYGR
jgi:hypothetical protein